MSLEVFLRNLVDALPETSDEQAFRVLDRTCKKIDVLGRMQAFYREDLSRPIDRTRLDAAYLPVLARLLLHWAERRRDAKLLDSALKLIAFREFDSWPEIRQSLAERAERLVDELVSIP